MADLYDENNEDVAVTPPTEEKPTPKKRTIRKKPQVLNPVEGIESAEKPVLEEPSSKEVVGPGVTEETTDEEMTANEAAEEILAQSGFNIEVPDVGHNLETDDIPDFDYGYKNTMTEENLDVDLKKLFTSDRIKSTNPTIFLSNGGMRSIGEKVLAQPNPLIFGERAPQNMKELDWINNYQYATITSMVRYDQYRYLNNDSTAKWRNGLTLPNGKPRGIRSPSPTLDRAKTSQSAATNLFKSVLNIGKDIDLFLYHSGFSVKLHAPSLSQFMMVDRKISQDNVELGRKTHGLIASADTTYAQRAIMDLFYDCLFETSIGVMDRNELQHAISVLDIPVIAWVLACAKYPTGFNLAMSCLANPNTCQHSWYSIIDPRQMYLVDENKLTERQRQIASIMRKQTPEEYEDYWSEFHYDGAEFIKFPVKDEGREVMIELANAPVDYAFQSADKWIKAITTQVETGFGLPLVGKERATYILEQAKATTCLKYAHFVNRIIVKDLDTEESVEITDEKEIFGALVDISNDELLTNVFMNGVNKFINRATNTIIAIPNVPCPECGGYHETDKVEEVGRHVVPIDPVSVFTILCQQQTSRYQSEAEAILQSMTPASSNNTSNESNEKEES